MQLCWRNKDCCSSPFYLDIKLIANGRNNFQHYWANNVGSGFVRLGCDVQTDLPTMLAQCWLVGVSHEVIALLSPRRQCAIGVRGPKNVGESCANGSIIVVLRSAIPWTIEMLGIVDSKSLSLSNNSQQHATTCNIQHCYIAGIFFLTARTLIGYFEVTWHLTIKLFPAKISEWATLQKSMTSEGNRALSPANVDRRPPLQRGLMNFQLYKQTHLKTGPSQSWSV